MNICLVRFCQYKDIYNLNISTPISYDKIKKIKSPILSLSPNILESNYYPNMLNVKIDIGKPEVWEWNLRSHYDNIKETLYQDLVESNGDSQEELLIKSSSVLRKYLENLFVNEEEGCLDLGIIVADYHQIPVIRKDRDIILKEIYQKFPKFLVYLLEFIKVNDIFDARLASKWILDREYNGLISKIELPIVDPISQRLLSSIHPNSSLKYFLNELNSYSKGFPFPRKIERNIGDNKNFYIASYPEKFSVEINKTWIESNIYGEGNLDHIIGDFPSIHNYDISNFVESMTKELECIIYKLDDNITKGYPIEDDVIYDIRNGVKYPRIVRYIVYRDMDVILTTGPFGIHGYDKCSWHICKIDGVPGYEFFSRLCRWKTLEALNDSRQLRMLKKLYNIEEPYEFASVKKDDMEDYILAMFYNKSLFLNHFHEDKKILMKKYPHIQNLINAQLYIKIANRLKDYEFFREMMIAYPEIFYKNIVEEEKFFYLAMMEGTDTKKVKKLYYSNFEKSIDVLYNMYEPNLSICLDILAKDHNQILKLNDKIQPNHNISLNILEMVMPIIIGQILDKRPAILNSEECVSYTWKTLMIETDKDFIYSNSSEDYKTKFFIVKDYLKNKPLNVSDISGQDFDGSDQTLIDKPVFGISSENGYYALTLDAILFSIMPEDIQHYIRLWRDKNLEYTEEESLELIELISSLEDPKLLDIIEAIEGVTERKMKIENMKKSDLISYLENMFYLGMTLRGWDGKSKYPVDDIDIALIKMDYEKNNEKKYIEYQEEVIAEKLPFILKDLTTLETDFSDIDNLLRTSTEIGNRFFNLPAYSFSGKTGRFLGSYFIDILSNKCIAITSTIMIITSFIHISDLVGIDTTKEMLKFNITDLKQVTGEL